MKNWIPLPAKRLKKKTRSTDKYSRLCLYVVGDQAPVTMNFSIEKIKNALQ